MLTGRPSCPAHPGRPGRPRGLRWPADPQPRSHVAEPSAARLLEPARSLLRSAPAPPMGGLVRTMGWHRAAPRGGIRRLVGVRWPAARPAALLRRARDRPGDARHRHRRVAGGTPRQRADLRLPGGPHGAGPVDGHRAGRDRRVRGAAARPHRAGGVRAAPRGRRSWCGHLRPGRARLPDRCDPTGPAWRGVRAVRGRADGWAAARPHDRRVRGGAVRGDRVRLRVQRDRRGRRRGRDRAAGA